MHCYIWLSIKTRIQEQRMEFWEHRECGEFYILGNFAKTVGMYSTYRRIASNILGNVLKHCHIPFFEEVNSVLENMILFLHLLEVGCRKCHTTKKPLRCDDWETSFSLVRNNPHGQVNIKTRDFEIRLIAALI